MKKIKILTFNLGLLIPNNKAHLRLELFLNEIKKEDRDYDLIFIQEVWPKVLRKKLIKESNYPYSLDLDNTSKPIIKLFPSKLHIDSGLLILSKYKPDNFQRLIYSKNGYAIRFFDGEALVNKSAIGCNVTINDTIFFIVNTHLVSHYQTCSYRFQRRQQFRELRDWVDLNLKDNNLVMTGDFNFSPPCPNGDPRFMNTDQDWLEGKIYFKDFNHIDYHHITTTYPHRYNFKVNKDEGCVDHIFTNNDLEIENEKTLFHNIHLKNGKELYISDHLAIEAEINIK